MKTKFELSSSWYVSFVVLWTEWSGSRFSDIFCVFFTLEIIAVLRALLTETEVAHRANKDPNEQN